jgi:hypothetical protein
MISCEQAFQDDLKTAINSYATRNKIAKSQALLAGISFLTKWMAELIPASPPRLAKRLQLTEESDDSREQCAYDHRVDKVSGITRADAPSALRQFRKRTEHDLSIIKPTGPGIIQAKSAHETAVLRYHCFIASEVDHFPYTTDWSGNLQDTAYRIMKAVRNPPKSADNEQDLLAKLNNHTSKKFELNTTTFSDGVYCGTPDAVLYDNGIIASVAEFKSEKDSLPAAKNQLIVYLVMLKISTGWIVMGPPSKAKITMVELTAEMTETLRARFSGYQQFLQALDKEKGTN